MKGVDVLGVCITKELPLYAFQASIDFSVLCISYLNLSALLGVPLSVFIFPSAFPSLKDHNLVDRRYIVKKSPYSACREKENFTKAKQATSVVTTSKHR